MRDQKVASKIQKLYANAERIKKKAAQMSFAARDVEIEIAKLQAKEGFPEALAMYEACEESSDLHGQLKRALLATRKAKTVEPWHIERGHIAPHQLPKSVQSIARRYLSAHERYEKARTDQESAAEPLEGWPDVFSRIRRDKARDMAKSKPSEG